MKYACVNLFLLGGKSLLSWERGLKSSDMLVDAWFEVAPLVGAWIEIHKFINESVCIFVAPLVGAWIEIFSKGYRYADFESLLSWERGLKC